MTRNQIVRRWRGRASADERGFTIIETMVAMGVVLVSLLALAYTATIGFRYVAVGRDRIKATTAANEVIERIRALPYAKIENGLDTADLAGDPNIATGCVDGIVRFEGCGSDTKIVTSTPAAGYEADFLLPHQGSITVDGLTVDYATYVTQSIATAGPYELIVIVTWDSASTPAGPNEVQVRSFVWSPDGCVSSNTHPFAAPCQPFFYGLAEVPSPTFDVDVLVPNHFVDVSEISLNLNGMTTGLQQEQIMTVSTESTLTGVEVVDEAGTGSEDIGGSTTSLAGDSDPSTTTSESATASPTSATLNENRLNDPISDCCGEVGTKITLGTNTGNASVTTAAAAGDGCPPTTAETDGLGCAGTRVRQSAATVVELPLSHEVSSLGAANLLRVEPTTTFSSAIVERDAVSNEDGIITSSASTTLGNIYIGGFPTAGMSALTGMSTTSTSATNYCLRIEGFSASAQAVAGESSSTDPSGSLAGTLYYYNGSSGYSSLAMTGTLPSSISCDRQQTVDGKTVRWLVTVSSNQWSPGSVATPTDETDADDADIHLAVDQTVTAPRLTVTYRIIVDGDDYVYAQMVMNLGEITVRGIYEPPPARTGV